MVNVHDAEWWFADSRGAACWFESEYGEPPVEFTQLGIRVTVLEPGQPSLYHAESSQEAFLVLSGECRLLVEGEERLLRPWDFVHSPPWTEHAFVGAGDGPCVILMAGARGLATQPESRRCGTRCRSSPRATAPAWRRRHPIRRRRTRQPSGSGESGRRTGSACPGPSRPPPDQGSRGERDERLGHRQDSRSTSALVDAEDDLATGASTSRAGSHVSDPRTARDKHKWGPFADRADMESVPSTGTVPARVTATDISPRSMSRQPRGSPLFKGTPAHCRHGIGERGRCEPSARFVHPFGTVSIGASLIEYRETKGSRPTPPASRDNDSFRGRALESPQSD